MDSCYWAPNFLLPELLITGTLSMSIELSHSKLRPVLLSLIGGISDIVGFKTI